MIDINGHLIMTEVEDVITDVRRQLEVNGIKRFAKIIKSGNNVMTCCPFHKDGQERKPSFGISTKDGTCHCFGCGWVGSLQEMVSNCFGYNDLGVYGSKWLIRNYLAVTVEERSDLELDFDRRNSNANNVHTNTYISEQELESYRFTHPYMYKRGLTDEVIDLFDIGYDKATECITFPIRDITGNTLFIARRSVNTKFFNYPESVEKPVYGLYELSKLSPYPNEIIICESMIDALTCWVYGKPAVALNGLGNALQFKQLSEMPCRKFILATDMDEAGIKARQRIRFNLKNKLVTEYVWNLDIAKDINDMSKEYFDNLVEVFKWEGV